VLLRGDGRAEPYARLAFAKDVLAGRAAEAQAKAERLAEWAAGSLRADDLARIVDEQGQLPERELVDA
jgi:hypothetical protein